jgi:probable selenium-dependent hydroxylase accessory protein YqeC
VAALGAALGVGRGDVVAVVGAGGKTTLVYRLAAEARASGLRVLVTTTTHMGAPPDADAGPLLVESESTESAVERDLARALAAEGRATVLGRRIRADKLEGLSRARVDALARLADLTLVEADGARGRSLKAPAEHEPVIPRSATLVIVVAALDVLGAPLDEARVHRVHQVSAASGAAPGAVVDPGIAARALAAPGSYPSRVPAGARAVVFLNKADDAAGLAAARQVAAGLVPPYAAVIAGSARAGVAKTLA